MQWVVVGTGALSTLWASGLQSQGEQVTLLTRHVEDGRHLELTAEKPEGLQAQSFAVIGDPAQANRKSVWLIIVKAWQLQAVVDLLAGQIPDNAHVILSHNGIGAAQNALLTMPDWHLYDLVTTQGAWRRSRLHSVHAGQGQSWVGPRQPGLSAVPDWFQPLRAALPPLEWDSTILYRRWHKLAVNCAINPLATLANVPNGILKNLHFQQDIRAVCEEVSLIAQAHLGKALPELSADQLESGVYQVIQATAKNRCSMLQDRDAGQRTEIDYLNGYICQLGEDYNIPTPVNQHLWQDITALT